MNDDGIQGDGHSYYPRISSDGRYVAFESLATNLVAGDTNGVYDIFVYDRTLNTIERVSVNDSGVQGDGHSGYSSISSDGRYVAFNSDATNLVAGDTNSVRDVFVYDRDTDTIERVSVNDSGIQGDGDSYYSHISSDGRYVAFNSFATNLVDGDTNSAYDAFVYDRDTGNIERVSVNDSGVQGDGNSFSSSISSDGRYVAFESDATNLVDGDTNSAYDAFVYDRDTGNIERVSVNDSGIQGNGDCSDADISSDGRYVAFESLATNLVAGDTNGVYDIFVYDRTLNTIERVSVNDSGVQGDGDSYWAKISSDGRYVAFESLATNLVAGDTNGVYDIFVYDRTLDTIERVSVNDSGIQGDGQSDWPTISSDGRYVAFRSFATNLVDGDTNGVRDIFVSGPAAGAAAKDDDDEWYECAIATAAYGGYTDRREFITDSHRSQIATLCKFRDERLLTNPLGRAFVRFYYRHSPAVADFIRDKEPLKAVVRAGLRPLVCLAKKLTH